MGQKMKEVETLIHSHKIYLYNLRASPYPDILITSIGKEPSKWWWFLSS